MKGKHAQKNFGAVGAMAPTPLSLKTPGGDRIQGPGPAAPPPPMGDSLHCALLLDYVPPEEPLGTPLGNTLRITRPKLD